MVNVRWRLLPVLACWMGCATAVAPNATPADASRVDGASGGHDTGGVGSGSSSGTCAMSFSGVLVTYNFAGSTGTEITTAASTSAAGTTASAIKRSSSLAAASGANSMNSSNWPSGNSVDPTAYYTLSLTPPPGCRLDVTSLAIDLKASASGPSRASIATSADAFGVDTGASTSVPTTTPVAVSGESGVLELRVYGYSASSTSGTMRLQNTLAVSGALH